MTLFGLAQIKRRRKKIFYIIVMATGLLIFFLLQRRNVRLKDRDEEMEENPTEFMQYRPPNQSEVNQIGKAFDVELRFLLPRKRRYVTLTTDNAQNFVIATAASGRFYYSSMDAISRVQKYLPSHQIIFYDLSELKENENMIEKLHRPANQRPEYLIEVMQKIKTICNVTYRRFNFTRYPPHAGMLHTFAWKPLVIFEILQEFPGVLWIDSSIRFVSGDLESTLEEVVTNEGMLTLSSTGHSNFAVTHGQMYTYLPTSIKAMINTDQQEANSLLLFRTRSAFENVIWWWALCALDLKCIAPTLEAGCQNPYQDRRVYKNCHRFDQSALNILLANYFSFNDKTYLNSNKNLIEVNRFTYKDEDIFVCPSPNEKVTINSLNFLPE